MDIDIATDAPPDVILDLFPNSIIVGLAFGVVIVVVGGYQFEVATFRRDIEYLDGRKPSAIAMSTPQEDATRRDFTINGMFFDPLEETIYDYVGGRADLKRGVIRTIGDPNERFIEDRLRMVRAVRFACRFGFAIDIDTQQAIVDNANTLFPAVAMERIWQELNKMAAGANFAHALVELHRLRLLPEIFPALAAIHLHDIKLWTAALSHMAAGTAPILALMVLFPSSTVDEKIEICRHLRTSNRDIALVQLEGECRHLSFHPEGASPQRWVHFYANKNAQEVIAAVASTLSDDERLPFLLGHAERQKQWAVHIGNVVNRMPVVTASHLAAQGIANGPQMGSLLKRAEALAIECDLVTAAPLVDLLLAEIRSENSPPLKILNKKR
jgi:poly(A) polymerase